MRYVAISAAPATVTAGIASGNLITGLGDGDLVMITTIDADCWIHTTGGTAAASAAGCIPIKVTDPPFVLKIGAGTTALTVIRAGGTDAEVTATRIK